MKIEKPNRIGRVAVFVRRVAHKHVWRSGGRRRQAVEVRRDHIPTTFRRIRNRVEVDIANVRFTSQHLCAVERENAGTVIVAARKLLIRHIIAVRPDTEFRKVVEPVVRHYELPKVIFTGRIAGLRERDELAKRREIVAVLRDQPAIGKLIVLHDREPVVP